MVAAAFPQAAISSTDPRNSPRDQQGKPQTQTNNNTVNNVGQQQRRPRGKQVPSRYMSPSPSASPKNTSTTTTTTSSSSAILKANKRYQSPLISRPTNSASNLTKTPSTLSKRSQSVDRRRSSASASQSTVAGGNGAEMSAATKMLITSTRSLSVSFQGEAFSLPISKKKETTTPISHRKSTPERRRSTPVRDHGENSRPVDPQLWPGTSRKGNTGSRPNNPLSRSFDCCSERGKVGSEFVGKSLLHHSLIDSSPKVSVDGRLSLDLGSADDFLEIRHENKRNPVANSANELASCVSCDFTASDSDSVSSGSSANGVQETGVGVNDEISNTKSLQRNIMASARFWKETNSRLRRLQDLGSPLSPISPSPSSRISGVSSKFSQLKRFSSDVPLVSTRIMASPTRGSTRPASPSKLWVSTTSPARAISSPSRVRNGVSDQMNAYNSNTPSILSFSADIRRGKIGEDRVMDAHLLRLLYNRYLQWRFVNARADYTFIVQRLNAEKNLWNAWVSISEMRHTVTLKRIKLLLLRQKLKLTSILRGQMGYLEEWSLVDRDHSNSLSGATEALKASTLRLPIVGKAIADIQDLKHAVGSAVDVMQAMASSICSLSMKVDEMNSVMAELMNIAAKEKVLLKQCQGFLSRVAAMQVTDCSMRTNIIQLSRISITSSLTNMCRN